MVIKYLKIFYSQYVSQEEVEYSVHKKKLIKEVKQVKRDKVICALSEV